MFRTPLDKRIQAVRLNGEEVKTFGDREVVLRTLNAEVLITHTP